MDSVSGDANEPLTSEWLDEHCKPWKAGTKRGWELLATVILRKREDHEFVPVFSHTGQGAVGRPVRTRGDFYILLHVLGVDWK